MCSVWIWSNEVAYLRAPSVLFDVEATEAVMRKGAGHGDTCVSFSWDVFVTDVFDKFDEKVDELAVG